MGPWQGTTETVGTGGERRKHGREEALCYQGNSVLSRPSWCSWGMGTSLPLVQLLYCVSAIKPSLKYCCSFGGVDGKSSRYPVLVTPLLALRHPTYLHGATLCGCGLSCYCILPDVIPHSLHRTPGATKGSPAAKGQRRGTRRAPTKAQTPKRCSFHSLSSREGHSLHHSQMQIRSFYI